MLGRLEEEGWRLQRREAWREGWSLNDWNRGFRAEKSREDARTKFGLCLLRHTTQTYQYQLTALVRQALAHTCLPGRAAAL